MSKQQRHHDAGRSYAYAMLQQTVRELASSRAYNTQVNRSTWQRFRLSSAPRFPRGCWLSLKASASFWLLYCPHMPPPFSSTWMNTDGSPPNHQYRLNPLGREKRHKETKRGTSTKQVGGGQAGMRQVLCGLLSSLSRLVSPSVCLIA